jgi:hypothetical protein
MKLKKILSVIILSLCVVLSSCEANTTKDAITDTTFVSSDQFSTSSVVDNTEFTTITTAPSQINTTTSKIAATTSSQITTTEPELFTSIETINIFNNNENFFYYSRDDAKRYESCLKILDAIKEKDEETLKWLIYYPEGDDGWLFNINVEEYNILSYSFGYFVVELDISYSDDERFPVGKSKWRIEFGARTVHPSIISGPNEEIENPYWGYSWNPKRKIDEAVIVACAYTTSFKHYEDVNDITIWSDYMTADSSTLHNYLSTMHSFEYDSGLILTEEVVNTFYKETLGISNTSEFVEHEFLLSGFTNDYLRLEDMKAIDGMEIYTIDDFYNDSLILTFYADSCFLTPAITMQYDFSIETDKLPQLLSVKVLKDYGYKPAVVDALSFG